MKNKVLYFPYINVPKSEWFTRMLLYWDQVGSIIPSDYISDPEKLDSYTLELVRAGLVVQVIPAEHSWKIRNLKQTFINYIHGLKAPVLAKRRKLFENRMFHMVHMEKLDGITDGLIELGLAQHGNYPWVYLEKTTAEEFMAYLAATLCGIDAIDAMPVTDAEINLKTVITSNLEEAKVEGKIATLRYEVLEDIFPAPLQGLSVVELERFKSKHADLLKSFRLYVEDELVRIASISDPELRERSKLLVKERMKEDIAQITARLRESGFERLSLGKLGTVIAALPGVSEGLNLLTAIYQAFEREDVIPLNKNLFYAAYAQKKLPKE